MDQTILTLENSCNLLYTSHDFTARTRAQEHIDNLPKDKSCLDQCLLLLSRSTTPYCQVVASTTLNKLVANGSSNNYQIGTNKQQLSPAQKFYLKNYLIAYLIQINKQELTSEIFVNKSIIKLIVNLLRYGWLDTDIKILNSEKDNASYMESKLIDDELSAEFGNLSQGSEDGQANLNNQITGTNSIKLNLSKYRNKLGQGQVLGTFAYRSIVDDIKFMYFDCPEQQLKHNDYNPIYHKLSPEEDDNNNQLNKNIENIQTLPLEKALGNVKKFNLGLEILTYLVCEMHKGSFVGISRPMTTQRKVTTNFRETCLKRIFDITLCYLQQIYQYINMNQPNPNDTDQKCRALLPTLINLFKVYKECLCYDFLGNGADESNSCEEALVQLPSTWRDIIIDGTVFNICMAFYKLFSARYFQNKPDSHQNLTNNNFSECLQLHSLIVACLAQVAAIKRTLFTSEERTFHISRLLTGMLSMMESPQALTHPDTYHSFCKYLCRIKTTYQLQELIQCQDYNNWLNAAHEFTVQSIISKTEISANSLHFLLLFWQKLAGSCPYIRSGVEHNIGKYASQIGIAYVESRIDAIKQNSSGNESSSGNEPFTDIDFSQLEEQLESISILCRIDYPRVCDYVLSILSRLSVEMDKINQNTSQPIAQGWTGNTESEILYKQAAWCIYVIGALVGSRITSTSTSETDKMDAKLVELTFRIISQADSSISVLIQLQINNDKKVFESDNFCEFPEDLAEGNAKGLLQLSILYFFKSFKRIYIGEQMSKDNPVYNI